MTRRCRVRPVPPRDADERELLLTVRVALALTSAPRPIRLEALRRLLAGPAASPMVH